MLASVSARVAALDWGALEASLEERGFARAAGLLDASECAALRALYGEDRSFRKRVDMERHRFGCGDYAYFRNPLPPAVAALRVHLYAALAPLARRQEAELGRRGSYPDTLEAFLARCQAHGQVEPTPLLLRYGPGGYNCLHQDRYGEIGFPLQATVLLSAPGADFTGGAFLLHEQRPRAQARVEVIDLAQGELVLFPSFERPLAGRRGFVRAAVRHGVARVEAGSRFTLGIIFHDAK